MTVEIGTEAAQFPEKECIKGIFLAVHNNVIKFSSLQGTPSTCGTMPWPMTKWGR
jgi:hypothetical protein